MKSLSAVSAILLCCLALTAESFAQVTYMRYSARWANRWNADSLFLGASMIVSDSTREVVVSWQSSDASATGLLYFVASGRPDSVRAVFHNRPNDYPNESNVVNLGRLPRNSPLVFMYTVTDTATYLTTVRGKRLYTGQNRPGTDSCVSEFAGPLGRRWAVVGKMPAGGCEVGFAGTAQGSYRDVRFDVTNATLVK